MTMLDLVSKAMEAAERAAEFRRRAQHDPQMKPWWLSLAAAQQELANDIMRQAVQVQFQKDLPFPKQE